MQVGRTTSLERRTRVAFLVAGLLFAPAAVQSSPADVRLFEARSESSGVTLVDWTPTTVRAATRGGRVGVDDFPLPAGRSVDLDLEPFAVTGSNTRFVVGNRHGADEPLRFDASSILFLRGSVRGRAGSSVFLALGQSGATGHIDLGPGHPRFRISTRDAEGRKLQTGLLSVFRAEGPVSPPPDVAVCGVASHGAAAVEPGEVAWETADAGSSVGLEFIELAVETDYEFFQLFSDLDEAAAYLVAMYGAVSDVYMRDLGTRIELVFARLWDDPDDLFNDVDPSPLSDFRNHWQANMTGVHRDVAQLLSGRRDYPFGGQAYLNGLCNGAAYSVVGYASGSFPDPTRPSPLNYDVSVTAHELGHNAAALHTHDSPYFLDTCNNTSGDPQRGTIMSYCGQTWSGGNANRDNRFHRTLRQVMRDYIDSVACVRKDCNMNGVRDAMDISSGTSRDVDGNNTPDECEDCNANRVLDDADVANATSLDLNGNGVPDECEPDCNANGTPDSKDLEDGTSTDLYGNAIPDECEADCNSNATSDLTDIQLDMSLDVDRDAVLDGCQDCDVDGPSDHEELAGSHNLWVASGLPDSPIRQHFATTGVLTRTSTGGSGALIASGQDLIVSPGGNIWVTSKDDSRVAEFAPAGAYLGDFVSGGSGGLSTPAGLTVTPAGELLVASVDTDSVLAYDASSGAFLGPFVTAGSGGLDQPFGLTLGPGGNLFVTSEPGAVLEYDGADGSFVRTFVDAGDNGGLSLPRGLVFKPDGNLLVASYGSEEVLEFEGATGVPLGKWARVGTETRLTQTSPWGIRIGPNGNVFVVRTGEDYGPDGPSDHDHDHDDELSKAVVLHLTNAQMYEYDVRSGGFIRTHIGGNDHGLEFPTGFAFVPGWGRDCNFNVLPDECDVASGTSEDDDLDGVPDECQTDCNANGRLDRLDIIPFGGALDCNANLVPDACDVSGGASGDCSGNGIPDECEADCNGNAVADSCDLLAGTSSDCNGNAVPDECDVFDNLEFATGWSISDAGDDATDGVWQRVNPEGTAAQPEFDHTPGAGRMCYVTGSGAVGEAADVSDVDGGRTTLTTRLLDLTSLDDPEIGYWRWFSNVEGSNPGQDTLVVDLSVDDARSWTNVEVVGPSGGEASGGWFYHSFRVSDFDMPTSEVRLRFVAADLGGDSTVEAAIDDLVVVESCCSGPSEPAEVQDVALDRDSGTMLTWQPQLGAIYDIAGGDLSDLQGAGTSSAICFAEAVVGAGWQDSQPDPLPGQGRYYLIRADVPCAAGTYGSDSSGGERQPILDCS